METAISVKNLSKIYKLYEKPIDRLKEAVVGGIRHKDFYALNDVSFDIKKGEQVGIIGVNGSGKSTVLKIITGVLSPSSGAVTANGKISALLELGAGFNPEYTGIENIYMNGTMMGFSKKEMDEKLQSILDFAEIGDFVYQPVKSYSSGMFVRLAFALSVAIEPEILVVDEALSVGDVFFQAKCYERMSELKSKGVTILLVTHDMGTVMKFCDRAILLSNGKKICEGTPKETIDTYKKILAGKEVKLEENVGSKDTSIKDYDSSKLMKSEMSINPNKNEYGNGKAEIIDFGIFDESGKLSNVILKGETFTIKEKIKFNEEVDSPIFTYTIKDKKGTDLTGTNTMFENVQTGVAKPGDEYEIAFKQKMTLQGGEYLLSISCTGFVQGVHTVYHRLYDLTNITIVSNKNTVGVYDMESQVSLVKL